MVLLLAKRRKIYILCDCISYFVHFFLLSNCAINEVLHITFIIMESLECSGAILWYDMWLILKVSAKMPKKHDSLIGPLLKMMQVCIDTIFFLCYFTLFRSVRVNSSPS